MSNHANPAKREWRARGFTLIEGLTVLATIGILTALSMVAYDAVGRRGALQNAAFDLQGVLSTARTRAASRGYPVWVVLYPTASRQGMTGGVGAFLVVEDRNSAFALAPARLFSLPLVVDGDLVTNTGTVSSVYFLEDYSKKVRFQALTPGRTNLYGAPFKGLAVQTCSFCSSAGLTAGAIGFYPYGGARFVDATGQFASNANQSLAFSSFDGRTQYLFAISGPAGYMASFYP